ncbi:MAG: hypothetical protein ABL974_20605 [Prosthecobacter sp.]
MPRFNPLLIPATLIVLAGCQTSPTGDPTALDGPIFGGRKETQFYMMPEKGDLRLRDIAVVARVLRKYRTLAAAEKELIRRSAQLQFSGLVALEIQRLEPKYEPLKQAARRSLPPEQARKKVAELDQAQQREALQNIAAKMGNTFALPVTSAENKSLMAFASQENGKVQVADALYEVDVPVASIPSKSGVSGPNGQVASVMSDRPINLPTP